MFQVAGKRGGEAGGGLPARLAEDVLRRYGYDLRQFAPAHLARRLESAMRTREIGTVSDFRSRLLEDPALMEGFLQSLSGGHRPMRKAMDLHAFLRREVLPLLRTYPFIRVWVAGCAAGPEAYALAILLHEEGLYERCRLYVTDHSGEALRSARDGAYSLASVRRWSESHAQAGGKSRWEDYYSLTDGKAAFLPSLSRNIVFAQYNLATDASFNEFNLILCRHALSALDSPVQERVRSLIHQSLAMLGYLALGGREPPPGGAEQYREVDARHRLYRKVG